MTLTARLPFKPRLRGIAVAAAMAAVSAGASAALSPFTLNPGAASPALIGPSFTADNALISDYSAVTFGAGGSFTDTGYLSVSAFQLGGSTFTPTGLNSTYGLYVAFTGTGTQTVGNPALAPVFGSFSSLTYTLYGYNGPASFGFSGNTATTTAAGVALASGSLINGSVSSVPTLDGLTFTPSANAKLSFNVAAGQGAFFASPTPFYNLALTAFTNTTSEVEAFDGGFRIRQGGGSFNFTSTPAVPEPQTYAMLLGGLAAVGFVARRRRT
ncbi:MAG TPA: flocculation-associated PEP-CTERM protein PepA [Burkholderiaceae bacterium]